MYDAKDNETYLIGRFSDATICVGETVIPSNKFVNAQHDVNYGDHVYHFLNPRHINTEMLPALKNRDDVHIFDGDLSDQRITLSNSGIVSTTKPELLNGSDHITFLVGDFSKATVRTGNQVHRTVPPDAFDKPMHDIIVNKHRYRFINLRDSSNETAIGNLDKCVDVHKFPDSLDNVVILLNDTGIHESRLEPDIIAPS